MIDFTPVRTREKTIGQLTADLTPDDLRRLTAEMIDQMLALIAHCRDDDDDHLAQIGDIVQQAGVAGA